MAKKSQFLSIMGDYPVNRVLDLLASVPGDHSLTEIAKKANVGYTTLMSFWRNLEDAEIVTLARTVGKAKMYKLNPENHVVQDFMKMYWEITKTTPVKHKPRVVEYIH